MNKNNVIHFKNWKRKGKLLKRLVKRAVKTSEKKVIKRVFNSSSALKRVTKYDSKKAKLNKVSKKAA